MFAQLSQNSSFPNHCYNTSKCGSSANHPFNTLIVLLTNVYTTLTIHLGGIFGSIWGGGGGDRVTMTRYHREKQTTADITGIKISTTSTYHPNPNPSL